MSALYFVFGLIPLLTVVSAILPELTGKTEPVPVGGFEYSIYLPKRVLILGGFGVSFFGIIFLLIMDGYIGLSFVPITVLLFIAVFFEGLSLSLVILYFSYRLTVRCGVIFYKLPCKKEQTLPLCEADGYSERKRLDGSIALVIRFGKKRIYAEGRGCDVLAAELCAKNIKKTEKTTSKKGDKK